MPLNLKQQIINAIFKTKNILVVFKDIKYGSGYPQGGDTISSVLALAKLLEKNNKNVEIASPNFLLPQNLSFLDGAKKIGSKIVPMQKTEININIKESGLKDFSYKIDGDFLKIKLLPQEGAIDLKNLKTNVGSPSYDLIIVLGTSELALLGDIYLKNKNLFDSVPIINIDNSAENENFGEINFVDIKSSSVSEVLWQLIEESKNLDLEIINCVLTGIISKTKNFKNQNLNPKTLEIVGRLIELGGNHNEIIEKLYKTKDIGALKLWGRALARLKHDEKIIWSLLTRSDFIHCAAQENVLSDVIYELIGNSPKTDAVFLLFETQAGTIEAIIYNQGQVLNFFDTPCPRGRPVFLKLPHKNLIEAEREILEKIKMR